MLGACHSHSPGLTIDNLAILVDSRFQFAVHWTFWLHWACPRPFNVLKVLIFNCWTRPAVAIACNPNRLDSRPILVPIDSFFDYRVASRPCECIDVFDGFINGGIKFLWRRKEGSEYRIVGTVRTDVSKVLKTREKYTCQKWFRRRWNVPDYRGPL